MSTRRAFIEGVGLAAATLASGVWGRLTDAGSVALPAEEAWHVDDMWGHRPRYAQVIPHAGTLPAFSHLELADPIDRSFCV